MRAVFEKLTESLLLWSCRGRRGDGGFISRFRLHMLLGRLLCARSGRRCRALAIGRGRVSRQHRNSRQQGSAD